MFMLQEQITSVNVNGHGLLLHCLNYLYLNGFHFVGLIEKQTKASESNSDVVLESIREDVRTLLPLAGVMPSENIQVPTIGPVSS